MKSFLFALQFLTIVPVRIKTFDEAKLADSIVYFPLIGLLVAAILMGINNLFLFLGFSGLAISVILVVALIILTGGLHLDGLSDTFDALLSGKDKEKMLEIMRDSHCGVMGVLSIICVISLKISFLYSINVILIPTALILMCVFSRWSLVFLTFLFPYARQDGKLKIYKERISPKIIIMATIFTVFCAFFAFKTKGLVIMVIAALSVYMFGKIISKKIGGITGDTLGAVNELVEVTVLLTVCILERMGLSWIM